MNTYFLLILLTVTFLLGHATAMYRMTGEWFYKYAIVLFTIVMGVQTWVLLHKGG